MNNPSILQVKNLKKFFPIYKGLWRRQSGEIKAVDGIDLTVESGQVVGIVGESGSGKSTAVRTAIRLLEPTSGESLYRGVSIFALQPRELKEIRKKIQIVFQDPYSSLNPRKKIIDNVGEALFYHEIVKDKKQQIDLVAETLSLVGLSPDIMNRYPHQFSGGQQQRICLARALILRPELLVCDEPVSALDVSIQAQILNLLIELKERLQLSYLFISHDLSVIRYICDHIIVLYRGRIVESRPTEELFNDPKEDYTKKLLSSIPSLTPRKSLVFSV